MLTSLCVCALSLSAINQSINQLILQVADNRSSLELLGQVPPNLLAVTSTFVSTESPARSISIGPGPAGSLVLTQGARTSALRVGALC